MEPTAIVLALLPELTAKVHAYAKAKMTLVWLYTEDNETVKMTNDVEKIPDAAFVFKSIGLSITEQFCMKPKLEWR